jgi:hypothetical protein
LSIGLPPIFVAPRNRVRAAGQRYPRQLLFIEEAYNQEPGVVQHIFNLPIDFTNGGREMAPSFTQEWPMFTQTHQFSYTIPYVFTEEDNGMEDMRLNYRLQAFNEDKYTPAFAPRLSLVLPIGDQTKDLGAGRGGL